VRTAVMLEEALVAANEAAFDLIICDILLGEEKGTELLLHIRKTGITYPVVMITGSPSLETTSKAVRVIAYTNDVLKVMVHEGSSREGL